jgi:glutamine amidotransferase-like uncharacterized protein
LNRIIAAALLFIFIFLLFILLSCSDHDLNQAVDNQAVDQTEETLGPPQEKSVQVELDETIHLPIIGIYSGEGSWPENVTAFKNFLAEYNFQWQEFNSDSINSDHFYEEVDMIIFPGGFAAEYRHALKNHQKIRSFVENGGSYVGICAGAYYAATIFNWQGTAYEYPLSIFPGTAAGPLNGELNWGDAAALIINSDAVPNQGFPDQIDVYYFDGPYFTVNPDNEESVDIIARYDLNDEAAVVAGSFGTGRYLLLGPHPELGRFDPEAPGSNTDGEDGAQWPWLYSLLLWLHGSTRG